MSRTKKINECRKKLLVNMKEYAALANGWDMEKEDDIESFEDALNEILEEFIE